MKISSALYLGLVFSLTGLRGLAQESGASKAAELKATLFAPGVISTPSHEGPFTFTPDGRTIYFTRFSAGMAAPKFFVSHLAEGHWSEPNQALMPQAVAASPLCFSPDGQRLYYTHERDATGRARLWMADWNGERWMNSRSVGAVFARWDGDQVSPSITADGTLFFSSNRKGGAGGWDLYRSRLVDGQYQEPVLLGPEQFSRLSTQHHEKSVSVSSNGTTLVFSSLRAPNGLGGSDLYLADLHAPLPSSVWASSLGLAVNSEADELDPHLSPDGQRLYFCRSGDIYEIDLQAWRQRPQFSSNWKSRANMPTPRVWPHVVPAEGRLYVYGGFGRNPQTGAYDRWVTTVEVYDPASDSWSVLGPSPRGWQEAALVSKDDRLFLFRLDGSGVAEYFPETKEWRARTNSQPFVIGLAAPFQTRTVVLGQKAYTMRSSGDTRSFSYFVEYDFETGLWTPRTSMPYIAPELVAFKGRIYGFSGGEDGTRISVFDPAADQWTEAAPMDMPRWEAGVAVAGEKIWLIGGHGLRSDRPMDGNVSPSVTCYDPEHNQWSAGPELPWQRGSVTAVTVNGRLFVMGGIKMGDPWPLDASVWEYVPAEPDGFTAADSDRDGLPDAWELAELGSLESTATADPDGDGQSNAQEYLAGTSPRDATSTLRLSATLAGSNLALQWPGAPGRSYRVWRASALGESWQPVSSLTPTGTCTSSVNIPVDSKLAILRLEVSAAP